MSDDLQSRTDEQLARCVGERHPRAAEAFEVLWARWAGVLAMSVRRRGVPVPDDQAVASGVMFKLWIQLTSGQFDDQRPIKPWLLTVASRDTASYFRRRKRSVSLETVAADGERADRTEPADSQIGVVDQLIRDESSRQIQAAVNSVLDGMNPRYAKALRLRHLQAESIDVVCRQLDCDKKDAYRLLDNARRAFIRDWRQAEQSVHVANQPTAPAQDAGRQNTNLET